MNKLIKHRKIIALMTVILSILFGVFIFNKLSNNNLEFIISNANNLKFINFKIIIFHLLLLNISFLFAFFGIGIIFLLIYLFFEGVIIGFMSSYFISLYNFQGFIYSIVYVIIFKALIIFLITILILKYWKLFKSIIKHLKKESVNITKTITNTLIICLNIILNDVFLLFFGEKLLSIFSFIIK